RAAEARLHEPFLLVGDWNTGLRSVHEEGKTFVCADHFAKPLLLAGRTCGDITIPTTRNGRGTRRSKRLARERVPAGSCIRDAEPPPAHPIVPVLARGARSGGYRIIRW